MYSIGELAKRSNITVRTLRYYDEIGLLHPTKIGNGGHRYYNSEAFAKLHVIILLKDLGFELDTIQEILTNKVNSPKDLLNIQLEIIEMEQQQLKKSKETIRSILQVMELEGTEDWEKLSNTFFISRVNKKEKAKILDKYFTDEEQTFFNKLPKIGKDHEQVDKWVNLIHDIRINSHKDPKSIEAQNLARRWMTLAYDIYDGNKQLAHKVWNINQETEGIEGFYQFDKAVVNFIGKACDHLFQKNWTDGNL